MTAYLPPSTTTIAQAGSSDGMAKDRIDWSLLFAHAFTHPPSTLPSDGVPTASPEGFSVGSPASSRDFESPLLDWELPFSADNEAALFPPDQPTEVTDWLATFNLLSSGNSSDPATAVTDNQPTTTTATDGNIASFLKTAALLTAQQHSANSISPPTLTLSQQQDQVIASALGASSNSTDVTASQDSAVKASLFDDDYVPIRGPATLPGPTSLGASPTMLAATSPHTVPDYVSRMQSPSWSAQNAPPMSDSIVSFSQQSKASTVQGSQQSSRGGSPSPSTTSSSAISSLATVFVREYARSHAIHDIDVLVRGLRLAGIDIADDILRDIVGPSPLSLGSPASQLNSPQVALNAVSQPPTSSMPVAFSANADFAMLLSGLGMAVSSQADSDTFTQSSSVSSLSSLHNDGTLFPQASQSQSQSAMSQSQSEDGWNSDASWTPFTAGTAQKTKVAQASPTTRTRSSVSTQRTTAKADILGSPATASANTFAHRTPSADGIMTTVWLPTGKRAFSCNVCHKLFDRAFNLRTHADTHKSLEEREKGKRFICPYKQGEADECGKPFARKHDCIRHWKTVHGKAVAGSNSAAAINKLKVPQPVIKEGGLHEQHEPSSSSSADEDELVDDGLDHLTDDGHVLDETSVSTGASSFG